MRTLVLTLPAIVSVITASAACGSTTNSVLSCPSESVVVASSDACNLALREVTKPSGSYVSCSEFCPARFTTCTIDDTYLQAFRDANPELTHDADAGGPTPVCPAPDDDRVKIECGNICEGRRTAGVREPTTRARSLGEYFATCAYLEATSVLAFERMHAELVVHGAPAEILDRVARARREEERHVELTTMLARRYGREPISPIRTNFEVRSLFEIARENLVEGCIRETWGAVLALLRAERAEEAEIRTAAREIAEDETRHAELAWDVAMWLEARLSVGERTALRHAADGAILELTLTSEEPSEHVRANTGLPTAQERAVLLDLLDRHVYRQAA